MDLDTTFCLVNDLVQSSTYLYRASGIITRKSFHAHKLETAFRARVVFLFTVNSAGVLAVIK